jgi:hypothetical protein
MKYIHKEIDIVNKNENVNIMRKKVTTPMMMLISIYGKKPFSPALRLVYAYDPPIPNIPSRTAKVITITMRAVVISILLMI